MSVNQGLHTQWQHEQRRSLEAYYNRLRHDAKGQTLTGAERARLKARADWQKKALANADFDARGRRLDYVTFTEEREELRRKHVAKRKA